MADWFWCIVWPSFMRGMWFLHWWKFVVPWKYLVFAWPSFSQWPLDLCFYMTSSRFWILSNSNNIDDRFWHSIGVRGWLSIMECVALIKDSISRLFYVMLPKWILAHLFKKRQSDLNFEINRAPRSRLVGASERQKEDISCLKLGWNVHIFLK